MIASPVRVSPVKVIALCPDGWPEAPGRALPKTCATTLNTPEGTPTDCITSPRSVRFPGFLRRLYDHRVFRKPAPGPLFSHQQQRQIQGQITLRRLGARARVVQCRSTSGVGVSKHPSAHS